MEIGLYEDWMKPQVAKLFSMQYGVSEANFSRLIDNFYELPFQKNKCIRIVAKEGEKVIGFQSFFYWPYTQNGKLFNSYQSGNSLVHPDYRGKGIFQKLLNYLDDHHEALKIDFLVGFPINASIGSLIRNKWTNLFNLQWFIKTCNPLSIFLPLNKNKLIKYFPKNNINTDKQTTEDLIKISNSKEFSEWRNTHYDKNKYFSHYYKEGKNELILKLKINIRKRVIKELIIGEIVTTSYEQIFIENAFSNFLKNVKRVKCISLVSIALNPNNNIKISNAIIKNGFKQINKQIYFCVKPLSHKNIETNPDKWLILRGDIDTW